MRVWARFRLTSFMPAKTVKFVARVRAASKRVSGIPLRTDRPATRVLLRSRIVSGMPLSGLRSSTCVSARINFVNGALRKGERSLKSSCPTVNDRPPPSRRRAPVRPSLSATAFHDVKVPWTPLFSRVVMAMASAVRCWRVMLMRNSARLSALSAVRPALSARIFSQRRRLSSATNVPGSSFNACA